MAISIGSVGLDIPGEPEYIEYKSGQSFNDYDVIIFNPELPYYDREHYSTGRTSLSATGSTEAIADMRHWSKEIANAVSDGKTVFIILSEKDVDLRQTGSADFKGKTTIHHTANFDNYEAMPFTVDVENSKGKKIKVCDPRFAELHKILAPFFHYEAYIHTKLGNPIFTTITGSTILGSIVKLKDKPGHLVFIPKFKIDHLTKEGKDGTTYWNAKGIQVGANLIKQIIEIDRVLRKKSLMTPKPNWVDDQPKPQSLQNLIAKVASIEKQIEKKIKEKEATTLDINENELLQGLLFENGKILEEAIEKALTLLGYEVTNLRIGSLEIDHVIINPDGKRYIGEAEGKDSSAIGIDKFRQLESNINEDFERDEVTEPASGILFGNGFRLQLPSERPDEFTEKCYKNAIRLGTALVKTSDLYPIAVYLSDNPMDDNFKIKCRKALEDAKGNLVKFPAIPK